MHAVGISVYRDAPLGKFSPWPHPVV